MREAGEILAEKQTALDEISLPGEEAAEKENSKATARQRDKEIDKDSFLEL